MGAGKFNGLYKPYEKKGKVGAINVKPGDGESLIWY